MTFKLRKEDCEAAVRNAINSENFVLKEYMVRPLYDKNVGFLGRHFRFSATIIHDDESKELHFFVKSVPITDSHRQLVVDHDYFGKEIAVYDILVPKLTSTLPPMFELPVPKCVFARRGHRTVGAVSGSEDEELIILEDVTCKGYRLLENSPPLDLAHCRAVLKALAKFHAASLLLEHSARWNPGMIPTRDLFPFAEETFLIDEKGTFGYEWSRCSAASVVTAGSVIWPQRFNGKQEKVLAALLAGWKKTFEFAKPSEKHQNVLCHGDLWTNNALFMYKSDSDGKEQPVDAILVDFQFVRYAPPITDILLLLHACTRKAFREKYMQHLLTYYHSSLENFASAKLVRKMLPLKAFLESYSDFKTYGIMISTGYVPVILQEFDPKLKSIEPHCEEVEVKELFFADKGEKIVRNCKKSEYYKERIEETFEECLRSLGFWEC